MALGLQGLRHPPKGARMPITKDTLVSTCLSSKLQAYRHKDITPIASDSASEPRPAARSRPASTHPSAKDGRPRRRQQQPHESDQRDRELQQGHPDPPPGSRGVSTDRSGQGAEVVGSPAWAACRVGDLVSGTVSNASKTGAFVVIDPVEGDATQQPADAADAPEGGSGPRLTGYIPRGLISGEHVDDPRVLFRKSERVTALVVFKDIAKGQITLSTEELEDDPGAMLTDRWAVYAQAEEALAVRRARKMEACSLQVGHLARGMVRHVDRHGVAVTFRAPKDASASHSMGSREEAYERLLSLSRKGQTAGGEGGDRALAAALRTLHGGIEVTGVLLVSSISRSYVFSAADHFSVGDEVVALVVGMDRRRDGRVNLSTWQLETLPGVKAGAVLWDREALQERAQATWGTGPSSVATGLPLDLKPPVGPLPPQEVWEELQEGALVDGRVTSVHPSGVTVRLEGPGGVGTVEGLLRPEHMTAVPGVLASDVFRRGVGEPLSAVVGRRSATVGRVQLSMLELEETAGDMLLDSPEVVCTRYKVRLAQANNDEADATEEEPDPLYGSEAAYTQAKVLEKWQLVHGVVLQVKDKHAEVRALEVPAVRCMLLAADLSRDRQCTAPDFSLLGLLRPGELITAAVRRVIVPTVGDVASIPTAYLSTAALECRAGDMLVSDSEMRRRLVYDKAEMYEERVQQKWAQELWDAALELGLEGEGGVPPERCKVAPSTAVLRSWLSSLGEEIKEGSSPVAYKAVVMRHLGLKRAAAPLPPVNEVVEGTVRSVFSFGVDVQLGVEYGRRTALLHKKLVSQEGVVMDYLFQPGQRVRALVLGYDAKGRVLLATSMLERLPGDMWRDPQGVFDGAEALLQERRDTVEAKAAAALRAVLKSGGAN